MKKTDFEKIASPGDLVLITANVGEGFRLTRNSAYIGVYHPGKQGRDFRLTDQISFDAVNSSDPGMGFDSGFNLEYVFVRSVERILTAQQVGAMGNKVFGPNAEKEYVRFFRKYLS